MNKLDELKANRLELNDHKEAIDGLNQKIKQLSIIQTELAYTSLPVKAGSSFRIQEN